MLILMLRIVSHTTTYYILLFACATPLYFEGNLLLATCSCSCLQRQLVDAHYYC